MKRFRWTLNKSLEFIQSRRPDIEIRSNFYRQLKKVERSLIKQGVGAKSYNWNDDISQYDKVELLVANTFLNSKGLSRERKQR